MKQALIDADGITVANVRIVGLDDRGQPIALANDSYSGAQLMLADDHYCGVGMVWDGDPDQPLFDYPVVLEERQAGSLWARTLTLLGFGGAN
jgi:hypothetical protein